MAISMRWMVLGVVGMGSTLGLCGGWLFLGDALLVDLRPIEFQGNPLLENTGRALLDETAAAHGTRDWTQMRSKRIPFELTVESHPIRPFLPIRGPVEMELRLDPTSSVITFKGAGDAAMRMIDRDGDVVLERDGTPAETPMGSAWTHRLIHRLITLPFAIDAMPVHERLGSAPLHDKTYDRVYVSPGPVTDVRQEQYLVGLDPSTARVAYVEMTGRDVGKAVSYRAEFRYAPIVESPQLPEQITVFETAFTNRALLTLNVRSATR